VIGQLANNEDLVDVTAQIKNLLDISVVKIERIGGGANSRVYRVEGSDGHQYVVKFYFRHEADPRDRLGTEFSSLAFLWEQGIRCIARPIAMDRSEACAIYEYIEGIKINSSEVTESDIDEVVGFLKQLKGLAKENKSQTFHPASEACFSVKAAVENIQGRRQRFEGLDDGDGVLHDFLKEDFTPFLNELTEWAQNQSMPFDREISLEERVLSPSDYGFHNALRNKEGRIIFLDFEYFGWDDPAKMISDFLLHPAMDLTDDLKKRFVTGSCSVFEDNKKLSQRLEIVYPFFGLKWCLIFLNEFVPEDLKRRNFAQNSLGNQKQLQERQLGKAKKMLSRIKETYKDFPYK